MLTTQTLLLFHAFLLITVSNHLRDHILTLVCSWSLFLNLNNLCEQHRSSNSRWRQSKKAVVLFNKTLFSFCLFLRIIIQFFISQNYCAVMWLNTTFALKLVVNISRSFVPDIWPSLLGIAYSAQRLLFALLTLQFWRKNLVIPGETVLPWGSWLLLVILSWVSPDTEPYTSRVWRYIVYWQGGSG